MNAAGVLYVQMCFVVRSMLVCVSHCAVMKCSALVSDLLLSLPCAALVTVTVGSAGSLLLLLLCIDYPPGQLCSVQIMPL